MNGKFKGVVRGFYCGVEVSGWVWEVEKGLCFVRWSRLSDRYRMKMKVLELCQVMASDKRHGNFDFRHML